MTIEQKAQRYDEAFEIAKEYHKQLLDEDNPEWASEIEKIFPELKESEDERIKRNIIAALKGEGYYDCDLTNECIAWLEKQGEPTDKIVKRAMTEKQRVLLTETNGDANIDWDTRSLQDVKFLLEYGLDFINKKLEKQGEKPAEVEPKFKVGDWVVSPNGVYWHIDDIYDGRYQVSSDSGSCADWPLDTGIYHRFTIQDAKDGDVLVIQKTNATYESIFIFKKIENNRIIQYLHYFTTDADEEVCEARSIDGFIGFVGTNVHPATKEQRNTLFAKMREAGYEWNAEKKELKKIEQNPAWCEEDKNFMYDTLSNLTELKDRYGEGYGNVGRCIDWLKSLKNKVQPQPKKEWSEKDELNLQGVIDEIQANKSNAPSYDIKTYDRFLNWLKSLKQRK